MARRARLFAQRGLKFNRSGCNDHTPIRHFECMSHAVCTLSNTALAVIPRKRNPDSPEFQDCFRESSQSGERYEKAAGATNPRIEPDLSRGNRQCGGAPSTSLAGLVNCVRPAHTVTERLRTFSACTTLRSNRSDKQVLIQEPRDISCISYWSD